jgi:hypothetical protein
MKNLLSGTLLLKSVFFWTLVNLVISNLVFAQDANYWTYQYGSRSTLLGGAVVGSILDLSGTYYNPGGLSLIDDPDIILAAKVFDYPKYSLSGSGIENAELTSSRLKPAPSIVATMFKFKWQGAHRLAISVFTRYDSKIEFYNFTILPQDIQNSGLNNGSFISDFKLNEKLNEVWGGITWSYKVGPKMGIGITQFLTFRNHDSYFKTFSEVITPEDDILLFMNGREFKYDFYAILWKLGITFDFRGLTFGLTATTPSLEFYSKGRSGVNVTFIGEDLDEDGKQDTWAAAHYQKDVDVDLHTPVSIGLGTTFKIYNTNIYFSTEWFRGINIYDVIPTAHFRSQIGGDTLKKWSNA